MEQKKQKHELRKNRQQQMRSLYFLAFAVPVFIILISFIKMGIRPFGGNSLLGMDLWSQYFPMIRNQYESRRQLAVDLFSWNGALGVDAFVQNAYYCNSPFNLLLLLAPLKYLIDALDYLILLKFGLAGLTFAVYCRYKFQKLDLFTVAFSSAYALCSYCLAFISQVMWFDAVLFFPLILMGMERLLKEKKPFLYVVTLSVTIYSGFYISFSICLFLVVYFFVYMIENYRSFKLKGILAGGGRFALYSLLAGGTAAFVLLPVYFGLGNTIASEIPAPSAPELYNTIWEYLSKLFPATPVSLQFDVPNIYSGCFILVFLPLFLMNKKIPARRKILYSVLVVFLYFSMNLNYLDYLWHGLHFPNQLPGRWTFIFSFIMILICYETVRNFDSLKMPSILISIGVVALVVVGVFFVPQEKLLSTESIVLGLIFIVLYFLIAVLMVKFRGTGQYKTMAMLLSVCIIVEMFCNSALVLIAGTEVGEVSKYTAYDEDMQYFKQNYIDSKDEFTRSELYYNWTFDHCQLFGLNGVTYYSSTMSANAYHFFSDLGYRIYAKNVSTVYCPYSPVLNSLLGIKYVVNLSMQLHPDYLKEVEMKDSIRVLENEKALPVMFAASDDILNWSTGGNLPCYEAQNSLLSAVVGEDVVVYKKLENRDMQADNASIISENVLWSAESYVRSDQTKNVQVHYQYVVPEDGSVYLCHNYKKGEMKIKVNTGDVSIILYRDPMKFLGKCKKDDVIDITVAVPDTNVGTCGLELYRFDETEFARCYDKITAAGSCRAQENGGNMTCTVNNREDTWMFTSVPAQNMICTVDGVETQIRSVDQYLAAVWVPAGEHEVQFQYKTKGFAPGVAVSAVCISALCAIAAVKISKKRKTAKKKSPTA